MDDFTATMRGKRVKVVFEPLSECYDGHCSDPSKPNKVIKIKESLYKEELVDTLLHEFLHFAAYDLKEETVNDYASDMTKVLFRLFDIEMKG